VRQLCEIFALHGAEIVETSPAEFEHEGGRQRRGGVRNPGTARSSGLGERCADTLQNTPTSLLRTISRRGTCTQRRHHHVVRAPDQPAASATAMKSSRRESGPCRRAAASPLVVTHLALRQGHHRLQGSRSGFPRSRFARWREAGSGCGRARSRRRSPAAAAWTARRGSAGAGEEPGLPVRFDVGLSFSGALQARMRRSPAIAARTSHGPRPRWRAA